MSTASPETPPSPSATVAASPKPSLIIALPDLPTLTVEPTFALYSLAETMSKYTFQNLLMQKSCRDNTTTEPDLHTPCDDEFRGGTFVALANSFFITPAFFWIVFYTLAAVTWSEQAGRKRKPLLFLPLIGLTIETAGGAFNSFFWSLSPYFSLVMYSAAQVFFGGRVCMVQGTYLYLMDTSNHESRTYRFAMVMTTRYACMVVGYFASGYLLDWFGFFYTFVTSFALVSAALLMERLAVPDISYPIERPKSFLQMINPRRTVELMKRITYRERSGYNRCVLAVALIIFMSFTLINEGREIISQCLDVSSRWYYFSRLFYRRNFDSVFIPTTYIRLERKENGDISFL